MAILSFVCKRCDKPFKAGSYFCIDGARHEVDAKTYYAPYSNLRVIISPERKFEINGQMQMSPCRAVEFHQGTFTTCDPEDQISLDDLFAKKGLFTREQWDERYIPKDERYKMRQRELESREAAIRAKENELLAKVKEETKG